MFGSDPRAAAIALPTRPLDAMYATPARNYIEARGGKVMTGAPARVQVHGGHVGAVTAAAESWRSPVVISAVPWFALPELFDGDVAPLAPLAAAARRTSACPIVTVNLWFDPPVLDEPFVGLPGRTMQWVFDKRLVVGEAAAHVSTVSSV